MPKDPNEIRTFYAFEFPTRLTRNRQAEFSRMRVYFNRRQRTVSTAERLVQTFMRIGGIDRKGKSSTIIGFRFRSGQMPSNNMAEAGFSGTILIDGQEYKVYGDFYASKRKLRWNQCLNSGDKAGESTSELHFYIDDR